MIEKKLNRKKMVSKLAAYAVFAVFVVSTGFVLGVFIYTLPWVPHSDVGPLADISKIQTTLQVECYGPDGVLKSSMVKDDDLILNNYLYLMQAIFTNPGGSPIATTLTDTSNIPRAVTVKQTGVQLLLTQGSDAGGFIQVATGTT